MINGRGKPLTPTSGTVLALTMLSCHAQALDAAPSSATQADPALVGAIDIHAHPDPDSRTRSIDAIDLAHLAKQFGMRGFVIKQHNDHTAGLAYLVRKAVPGVDVFGMLVLNRAMGGVNVAAVERFAQVAGGWGRIVSMPTFDADAGLVAVSRDGELLPEVKQVLATMVATRTRDSNGRLALATGHATPAESLMLVSEARALGLNVVVTHPLGRWTVEQMREAARMGAFLEFVAAAVLAEEPEAQLRASAEAIREIGPESVILSSDLGRPDLPQLHPSALARFASGLRRLGFTDTQLALMMRSNPARLLGLSDAPPPAPALRR